MASGWQQRSLSLVLAGVLGASVAFPVLLQSKIALAQNNPSVDILDVEAFSLFQEGSERSLRQAQAKYAEIFRLSRTANDRPKMLEALVASGLISNKLKDYSQSLEYFSAALPLSRAISDRHQEAMTLLGLGIAQMKLGQQSNALGSLKQSLPIFRELKNVKMEKTVQDLIDSMNSSGVNKAVGLINEGKRLFIEGSESSLQQAQQRLIEAIRICQSERNKSCLTSAFMMIGIISDKMGDKRKALEYFNQALPLSRETRNQEAESNLLFAMGMINFDLKNTSKALSYFEQALPIFRAIGNSEMEGRVRGMISVLKNKNR